jgi:hypothetical protein
LSEDVTEGDPDGQITTGGDDPALSALAELADAGLVDWESAVDGEPASRTLPTGRIDLILLSGEGSELEPNQLMYPLVRGLALRTSGVEVGEIRTPRSDIEVVDDPEVPARGEFVDPLRADGEIVGRIITIDNVDEPFGRLASVLALAGLPTLPSGAYGVAPTADQPFPPPAK